MRSAYNLRLPPKASGKDTGWPVGRRPDFRAAADLGTNMFSAWEINCNIEAQGGYIVIDVYHYYMICS